MANQITSPATAPGHADDPRFRRLLEIFPAAAYTCDIEGLITSFNHTAVELWGREPQLNHPADRYCGSHKLFSRDGLPILHECCWMALALQSREAFNRREIVVERPDGSRRTVLAHANPIFDDSGRFTGAANVLMDISDRSAAEEEVRRLNLDLEERVLQRTAALETAARELRDALDQIKTLRGLVPICSWCKRIRDDMGFWQQLEFYLHSHTGADFTHGICPDCATKNHRGSHRHRLRS
jgi:PAS domain S-box-containing protein